MTNLLIVGATGLVGSELMRLALQDKRVTRVIAVTRRPVAPQPKLENQVVDFNNLPTEAAWWQVDAAICALGTTTRKTPSKAEYHKIDVAYPLAIAKLVKKHGAKTFGFVSALGASANSHSSYLRMKAEVEAGLATIGFESLTIARPSLITGDRSERRTGEELAEKAFKVLKFVLPQRLHPVPAKRIAKALLEAVINKQKGNDIIESERL